MRGQVEMRDEMAVFKNIAASMMGPAKGNPAVRGRLGRAVGELADCALRFGMELKIEAL